MTMPIDAKPYTYSASIYDGMMEHVEYGKWAKYIDALLTQYGRSIHRVCELACGTGTIGIEMNRLGYSMTCSDGSSAMVSQAMSKARRAAASIHFESADMLDFRSDVTFDAVLCLYDSVNYLLEENDVRKWLLTCSDLLADGGLLIFDSCTESNSLQHFDERFELDRQYGYIRRSKYLRDQRMQINEIELTIDGIRFVETHRQRIYAVSTLRSLIQECARFSILAVLDDLGFEPGDEESERIHWILKKKARQ